MPHYTRPAITIKQNIAEAFSFFEKRHPAFFYSLFLLLGFIFVFQSPYALLPALLIVVISRKKAPILALIFLLPLPLFQTFFPAPPVDTLGKAYFHITSISKSKSRFSSGWTYRGSLRSFQNDGGKKHRTLRPCTVLSKTYFPPKSDYLITGKLSTENQLFYVLKSQEWTPVKKRWSLIETRVLAKACVKAYIHRVIEEKQAALFLTGLIMGELEDREMLFTFGKLGLSHIMAISGFHFALLTLFLHFGLRLFFSYKIEAAILIGALTLYLLFLGLSPSVLRAWIMAMLFLFGQIFERKSYGFNTLAVAMAISLILDPFIFLSLSFQLSFLATAGIFLLYRPMDFLLERLFFPKYALSQVVSRSKWWQCGYIISSIFRKSLALTLAVNAATVPILLSRVHAFPLHSFFYNLFFPFLTTLSIMLFLISLPIHLVLPPIGQFLHKINGWYTKGILEITDLSFFPQKTIYVETMPGWVIPLYLTFLFISAVLFHYAQKKSSPHTYFEREKSLK